MQTFMMWELRGSRTKVVCVSEWERGERERGRNRTRGWALMKYLLISIWFYWYWMEQALAAIWQALVKITDQSTEHDELSETRSAPVCRHLHGPLRQANYSIFHLNISREKRERERGKKGGGEGFMISGEYHDALCFVRKPVCIKSLSCVNVPAEIRPIKTLLMQNRIWWM